MNARIQELQKEITQIEKQLEKEKLLEEISFSAGAVHESSVEITASYVDEKLGALAVNEDLSRYVL